LSDTNKSIKHTKHKNSPSQLASYNSSPGNEVRSFYSFPSRSEEENICTVEWMNNVIRKIRVFKNDKHFSAPARA